MAISKATWRAFETLEEPWPSSTWCWLGRSTPQQLELIFNTWLPVELTGGIVTFPPQNPGPLIEFKQRTYSVSDGQGVFQTLAWDSTVQCGAYPIRMIFQHWITADFLRCALTLRSVDVCFVWVGQVAASQRDARCVVSGLRSALKGTAAGENLTASTAFLYNGCGFRGKGPAWFNGGSNFEMLNATSLTSITLAWDV